MALRRITPLLLWLLIASSCGTIHTITGQPHYYLSSIDPTPFPRYMHIGEYHPRLCSGTFFSVETAIRENEWWWMLWALDVPASFVADTAALPITLLGQLVLGSYEGSRPPQEYYERTRVHSRSEIHLDGRRYEVGFRFTDIGYWTVLQRGAEWRRLIVLTDLDLEDFEKRCIHGYDGPLLEGVSSEYAESWNFRD